jgi:hypothetical protein
VKFPLKNICKSQMYFEHSIINQLNLKGFILFFILFLFFFFLFQFNLLKTLS